MAEIVSFKIRIDDEGSFKKVEVDADDLRRGIGTVVEETQRLNSGLINMSQLGQVIDQLGSAIGQIESALGGLSEAYAVQEAAETRLAQAMRNTMDATNEDIDAIKQLCSAQQALGVIGDEVQMSGAQELATYLEKRSSLEKLIPVMNDMLAQQYEYNATSENAAQIASMLGKVMNGQTEALSRYGYKFDEAQKKVLQFGTEEERAAVLAEVVQQSVGGMNATLAQTPTGRMAQAANLAGDLKEQLGAAATRVMPLVQGLASLTQAATGIGKVITSIKSLTAALKAAEISSKGLKAALGGIAGIALAGVIAAMGALAKKNREAREEAEKANEEYRQMQDRLAGARSEIELDIQRLNAFNGSVAEENRLVKEMNEKWGDSFGTFSTVSEWYKTLSENVESYCAQVARQIELDKIANDVASAKIANQKIAEQLKETPEKISYDVYSSAGAGGISVKTGTRTEDNEAYQELLRKQEENERIIQEGQDRMKTLFAEMAENTITPPGGGGPKGGFAGATIADDIDTYRKRVQAAIDVNDTFNNGQDEFVAQANAMKTGIVSLIQKYGLENEEVQKLISEYRELREAKLDAMIPELDSSSLGLPTTLAQPEDNSRKPSSADFSIGGNATENLISMQDAAAGASSAMGALGDVMGNLSGIVGEGAAGWLTWGANLLKAIGQALPQLAALFAGETAVAGAGAMSAVANIPYVGPILAVAALASIVAAAATLPKFAEGAIAYGPTLGLFGEYPGAANNPEVVAPLNKLRDLIEPQGASFGKVVFEIDGYTLKGILKKVDRLNYRSNG